MDWNKKIYPSDILKWIIKWKIWQGVKIFYDVQKEIIKNRINRTLEKRNIKAKASIRNGSTKISYSYPPKRKVQLTKPSFSSLLENDRWNTHKPLTLKEREKVRRALDIAMKKLNKNMKDLDFSFRDVWDTKE